MAIRVCERIARSGLARRLIAASPRGQPCISGFHSLRESNSTIKLAPCQSTESWRDSILTKANFQRFQFSASASPQPSYKEDENYASQCAPDNEVDLSRDELIKLVAEKEDLLKLKHKEIEKMQDKVLRSYAEMENVIDRTKREAENSKKFAVQAFAKSLLDVADNMGRASAVVKESFPKIDAKNSTGAVSILKTLLEGVEMTEKQLGEVFKKFGVEKFDPVNEQFDPHRHLAVFQIPDASRPPSTVAVVLKSGYMLYDRVLRPAEVGVTEASNNDFE